MTEENKLRINGLLNFLDEKLKKQEIIEITEKENKSIYDYLEKEGFLNVSYSIENKQIIPIMIEIGASIDLWYKDINKNWIIKMYQINKMLNANWK
jgi:ribosomal protein S8